MEENDLRTVRVYTKKYKSKDSEGNLVEKESKQKHVSLKKDDPYEDNDLVVVLSREEYEKLHEKEENNESITDALIKKDEKISDLEKELEIAKSNSSYELKEQLLDLKEELINAQNKTQDIQDKLNEVEDERAAIFKELDYKNKMILAYNVELNKSIYKAIDIVVEEAKNNVNRRNYELAEGINKSIAQAKLEVNEKNKAIAYEINSTIDAANEEIRNTSMIKMLLNKHKINIIIPTDDLLKPFEFNFDAEDFLKGQTLELDTSEILKEVMPKLPEPFSNFIETNKEENKTIDIESKKEE